MKLFRRIAAIAAAMTMAVSMMAVNASANTWDVYRQNRGNGTYSTYATYQGYLLTFSTAKTCQVNCTSFYTERPSNVEAAYVQYHAFVSNNIDGTSVEGLAINTQSYYNTSAYSTKQLMVPVKYGQYLQFRFFLKNYQNVNNCSMSGNYIF